MVAQRIRGLASALAFGLVTAGLSLGMTQPAAAAVGCGATVPGDVNGDGYADLAVGEPFNGRSSGSVHIFYGQQSGLVVNATGTALDDQLLDQATPGVPGSPEDDDNFGLAVLLADFNGDNCADLAVGVPGENGGSGMINVLYGSPTGIRGAGAQGFTENALFGPGSSEAGDSFGGALASGDLNDDGFEDLVVGASGEQPNGVGAAGGVGVLYGAPGGLNTGSKAAVLITQSSPGVPGVPEEADQFGSAVATGDVDGNGVDDLIVGVPGENNRRGIIQVLPGQAGSGVGVLAASTFSQNTPGVPGVSEVGDRFGAAVAAGDATGDGKADVVVGAPGENSVGDSAGQGAVSFLRGSAGGLTGKGAQIWSQNSPGVQGVGGPDDEFGWSLVMAPLDSGPLLDVAIGAPNDAIGSIKHAGSVTVLLGSAGGLTTAESGGTRFHQNTPGIAGASEPLDFFGLSLAAPLIQAPDIASLVIGAPAESIHGVDGTGQIHQLQTFEFGPNPSGSVTLHLDTPGVKGLPGGGFGFSLG